MADANTPTNILIADLASLPSGGVAVDFPVVDCPYDGRIVEIVANVVDPTDTGTNNTKFLYETVAVKLAIQERPVTDGKFAPIRAIGGSQQLPGMEWNIRFKRGEKIQASAQPLLTTQGLVAPRVILTFRVIKTEG